MAGSRPAGDTPSSTCSVRPHRGANGRLDGELRCLRTVEREVGGVPDALVQIRYSVRQRRGKKQLGLLVRGNRRSHPPQAAALLALPWGPHLRRTVMRHADTVAVPLEERLTRCGRDPSRRGTSEPAQTGLTSLLTQRCRTRAVCNLIAHGAQECDLNEKPSLDLHLVRTHALRLRLLPADCVEKLDRLS